MREILTWNSADGDNSGFTEEESERMDADERERTMALAERMKRPRPEGGTPYG